MMNLVIALMVAGAGFALALRFLPKTSFYGRLVNETSVPRDSVVAAAGGAAATGAIALPEPGARGVAVTDLRPLGEVDIAGARYQARAAHGQINRGEKVEVVGRKDFALAVKSAEAA
jgi:membrane-bound serine protease (ClpP class)